MARNPVLLLMRWQILTGSWVSPCIYSVPMKMTLLCEHIALTCRMRKWRPRQPGEILNLLSERWKQSAGVVSDQVNKLRVRANYGALATWTAIRKTLSGSDLVQQLSVIEMSVNYAYVDIAYIGSVSQLAANLEQAGLQINETEWLADFKNDGAAIVVKLSPFVLVVLGVSALVLVALVQLSEILLPFVLGFTLAYFLDPLADRLERVGLPGLWPNVITFAFGFSAGGAGFRLPALAAELGGMVERIPVYTQRLEAGWRATPF